MFERRSIAIGVTMAFAATTLVVESAEACSPPYEESEPPCTSMRVVVPGHPLPANLAHLLRVKVKSSEEGVDPSDIEALPRPTVWLQTSDGYESASFELVQSDDLVDNARSLRLDDPVPGEYLVVWSEESCGDPMPAPVGDGALIREFELSPEAAPPEALGETRFVDSEIVSEEVSRGIAGDCSEITASQVRHKTTLELELDESMIPYSDVVQTSLEVDGDIVRGWSRGGAAFDDGVNEHTISHLCSASDREPDELHNKLEEGEHEAVVIGRAGDYEPIRSNPVKFEIDCTPNDNDGGSASGDAACSVASTATPSGGGWLALLLALGLWARRPRR